MGRDVYLLTCETYYTIFLSSHATHEDKFIVSS